MGPAAKKRMVEKLKSIWKGLREPSPAYYNEAAAQEGLFLCVSHLLCALLEPGMNVCSKHP